MLADCFARLQKSSWLLSLCDKHGGVFCNAITSVLSAWAESTWSLSILKIISPLLIYEKCL